MSELANGLRNLDSERLKDIVEALVKKPQDERDASIDAMEQEQPHLFGFFRYLTEKAVDVYGQKQAAGFSAGVMIVSLALSEYARAERLNELIPGGNLDSL